MIQNGFNSAYTNMAIDEAILVSRIQAIVPNTVRFYRWKPSAVSVGFSQEIMKEVEVETCKSLGVDIVRRPTGGGTVYHDSLGELTYAIVADLQDVPSDLISSYSYLCEGIIWACRELGLEAQLTFDETGRQCPNITVNGKKISGGAQTRRRNALLQHGTILIDSDLEAMTRLLKMGSADACMPLERLQSKVTTLRRELQSPVSLEKAEDCLRIGFEHALGTKLVGGKLTSAELNLASELCHNKYETNDWNFRRCAR